MIKIADGWGSRWRQRRRREGPALWRRGPRELLDSVGNRPPQRDHEQHTESTSPSLLSLPPPDSTAAISASVMGVRIDPLAHEQQHAREPRHGFDRRLCDHGSRRRGPGAGAESSESGPPKRSVSS